MLKFSEGTVVRDIEALLDAIRQIDSQIDEGLVNELNESDETGRKAHGSAKLVKQNKIIATMGGAAASKRREIIHRAIQRALSKIG